MIKNIKDTLKSIWVSKPTIYTTIINIIIFIVLDTKYTLLNLLYGLISNIIALLTVNLIMGNIKKNNSDEYEKYYNWLPGTFCMFRFSFGLFATWVASTIQLYSPVNIISENALSIVFSWLVFPLVSTMIVASSIDYKIETKNIIIKWWLQIKYLWESLVSKSGVTSKRKRFINLVGMLILLGAPIVYWIYRVVNFFK